MRHRAAGLICRTGRWRRVTRCSSTGKASNACPNTSFEGSTAIGPPFNFLRQKTPPFRAGDEGRSGAPCARLSTYRRACGNRRLWSGGDNHATTACVSRSQRSPFGVAGLVRCEQPRNPLPLGMGSGQFTCCDVHATLRGRGASAHGATPRGVRVVHARGRHRRPDARLWPPRPHLAFPSTKYPPPWLTFRCLLRYTEMDNQASRPCHVTRAK